MHVLAQLKVADEWTCALQQIMKCLGLTATVVSYRELNPLQLKKTKIHKEWEIKKLSSVWQHVCRKTTNGCKTSVSTTFIVSWKHPHPLLSVLLAMCCESLWQHVVKLIYFSSFACVFLSYSLWAPATAGFYFWLQVILLHKDGDDLNVSLSKAGQ